MGFNQLNVTLGAKIDGFQKAFSQAEKQLNQFARKLENTGRDLTTRLTIPIVAVGAAAVSAFAEFEKSAKALEAVVGSAKLAGDQIERLRKIAKLPGLGFEQAVKASARLQAVGLSAKEAEDAIAQFGNAVARSGGGAAEFDGAILALTQIASKGKISAEEINQLNERIFEIRPALQAAFGTADSEQLQKLGISSQEFIAKVTEELAKLERVQGGLGNAFENFRDSVRSSLAVLGEQIAKTIDLEGIMNRLAEAVAGAAEWFKNLNPQTKQFIIIAAGVAAAIGPVLFGLGSLVKILPTVAAGFRVIGTATTGPVGLAAIAIGAFAVAIVKAYQESPEFREQVARLWQEIKILGEQLGGVLKQFEGLGDVSFSVKDIFGKFTDEVVGLTSAIADLLASIRQITGGDLKTGFKNFFAGLIDSSSLGQFARFFGVDIGDKVKGVTTKLNADLREALNPLNEFFEQPGAFTTRKTAAAVTTPKSPTSNFTRTPKETGPKASRPLAPELPKLTGSAFGELAAQIDLSNVALLKSNTATDAAAASIEQVRASTAAWQEQVAAGIPLNIEAAVQIETANAKLEEQSKKFQNIANILSGPIQEGFSGFFDTLLSGGKNAFKSFTQAIAALIKKLLTAVATALALSAVFSLITGGTSQALSLFKFGGSGFGSLFKGFLGGGLGFASGGLVYGPVTALIGEGPGTTRANPEVVAPLDKLQSILNNTTSQGGVLTARISGDDLLILLERAERNRNR